jgi:hypothetical protein
MSEYQYYEFRTIDRPLTDRQMRELRAISTRAAISRTSFSNYYTYGNLKANPRDLLVRYFDASLCFANWLFLELAFRYPKSSVDMKALRRYAAGHTVEIRSTARDVIVAISLESDGESFDTAADGSSWLSSLIALRADIASGDERALYLAWLLDVQCGEIDDDAVEPGRPDGLGRLSPTLDSFVDIMGIDRDLIAAAAEGASRVAAAPSARQVERWIAALDTDEHVALLSRVARGDGSVGAELMRRSRPHTPRQLSGPLRTAGALRAHAASIAEARRQTARQREARERARREREQQVARARYLTGLAKRERQAWQRVDALVGTKRPADYAAAVELLVDLRDVSGRTGRNAVFGQCIAALRKAHAKKPSLLARLRKVGL